MIESIFGLIVLAIVLWFFLGVLMDRWKDSD